MKIWLKILLILFLVGGCASLSRIASDEYIWLEDPKDEKVKKWIGEKNSKTENEIAGTRSFKNTLLETQQALSSKSSVPNLSVHGKYLYAIHRPSGNSKGVWKRTKYSDVGAPVKDWETVLDIDRLNRKKNKKYTFKGAVCLKPQGNPCLLSFSEGGGDKSSFFEFDVMKKVFVKNGFKVPAAKTFVAWIDKNHVALNSSFNGVGLTNIGFSTEMRVLKRGVSKHVPKVKITIPKDYVAILLRQVLDQEKSYTLATRFYSEIDFDTWVVFPTGVKKIDLPKGSRVIGVHRGNLIVSLARDWVVGNVQFNSGDVLAVDMAEALKAKSRDLKKVNLIYRNQANHFLGEFSLVTKNFVVLNVVDNVRGNYRAYQVKNGKYKKVAAKAFDKLSLSPVDSVYAMDKVVVKYEGFLTPPKVSLLDLSSRKEIIISEEKESFDARDLLVFQKWAISSDGVSVPYYLVGKEKAIKSGMCPVIVDVYGAYGVSRLPKYKKVFGKNWLEKGGALVLGNIRGGGELGPSWYSAGVKENKEKSIEDTIAIVKDLIENRISKPSKIGLYGGSMGGVVLAGATAKKPSMFKAVAMMFPVIDLIRGKKLINGNWLGEIGDPDNPKERRNILDYSGYHNLKSGVKYPNQFLFSTSTDDRVDPANSRKWVAKIEDLGKEGDVYYLETNEGGHAGSSTNNQKAFWKAVTFEFFKMQLMYADSEK